MMSPDEALAIIEMLAEDIEEGCTEFYGKLVIEHVSDENTVEALKVAVECLKEKCHE